MNVWHIVLIAVVFYALVAVGFGIAYNWKMGALWPLTLLWMLLGNIQ